MGKKTFFLSAIANLKNSRVHSLLQIRKFLRCASPQTADPQIFILNPQIRKFLQKTAQLCLKQY